ncbi:protein kinase [Streptomyces sp. NPDC020898]|uniref:protein kinase domain-containing protein n=1 Tax=Streptomyces sp. NPDC020898 TaxID=3365101 RepID=UPI0037A98DC1
MSPDPAAGEAAALRQTGAVPLRPADPERIGPYVPLALLGSGGMGRVYLARPADDSPGLFAVKVIRPEYAEDERFRRRFEHEAAVHGQVRTPHAPRLCGTGFQDELLWMATEYLAALDLSDAVREDGALAPGAVWRLVAELGQALADLAATGIVHRDLKPSNVLLSVQGAHVIDFGISKAADASSITGTGNRVGTPAYMSPEYLRTGHCDPASDVFSLAGTLIYAAAGRAPFGDGTGVDVMHRVAFEEPDAEVIGELTVVDPALGALLSACLSKEPALRPTPAELIEAAAASSWGTASEPPAEEQTGGDGRRGPREADPGEGAGASATASGWPEPLHGRVLARQRAYETLYRVPVERAPALRFPGHRPKSAPPAPMPLPAAGVVPAPAAAAVSAEPAPERRRPARALAWARRKPVPVAAATLALCALAAVGFVLVQPDGPATALPPGSPATAPGFGATGDDASSPKPVFPGGSSLPGTSGNGTVVADGPANPSEIPDSTTEGGPTDPTSPGAGTAPGAGTGTETGAGTETDPGTDPGTGTGTDPTPSPDDPSTEPATAPWITDCTYYSGNGSTALGDQGKKVTQAQCILAKRGYDIGSAGVDGNFGESTEAAVLSFQSAKGLDADGIVGKSTWAALRAAE